jgi:hypothetical protein
MSDENVVNLEVVKSFIEANKADPTITEFISSIAPEKPINPDVVKGYLETMEGKSVVQPMFDSFANRAIQSHDEKKKKEIEAEIARKVNEKLMELNKEDTPEQRMIKEQAIRMKELEDKYENDKKLSKINEIAYKEGIDPAFVSGISFDSAEQFGLYANNLKNYIKKANEKAVNDFVASNSVKPGMGKQEEGGDPTKGMDSKQKFEYYKKEAEARENRTA